ncbi:TonB-dependent receptor [Chitinophaga pendula]|uniref:TonB-dependent receptor n=1 Tax=Chitinophaga TaxID=79328 RepID=UPI000BAFAB17|nr:MULTISPECIES: TonB-dependent receptor [Chitinophaga]ASZ14233.1 TonB-dependent receptor [Chitinophaga sp. MD30]UCJ08126.1 TonB-dependent receptor [Chitinophaga pendula]
MKKCLLVICCLLWTAPLLYAQHLVKGKIIDNTGTALPGVSVFEKGTNKGTSSSPDGSFQFTASNGKALLVFRALGYVTQEVPVAGKSELQITLQSEATAIQGVEVVGSRNLNRSATQTPVPIDIIPISRITNSVGQVDLNQLMQFAAPSFNSNRQTGSDGADHVDPASLRGLGPDQTLVLINGKRRHQSSLVNLFGTRGRGNTGTDLNTIPAAAIERIEILRDGASAQYGSDAIAGVINIVLKSSVDEFSGNINGAVTSKGDGQNIGFNGNYGFKIGGGGFVNVTGDYLYRGRTNRADDPNKVGEGNVPRRFYGDALMENYSAMFNARIPLTQNTEIYSFGGYNQRYGNAYAFTRYKDDPKNIPSIYPNGFDPQIVSNIGDRSLSVGIRGLLKGWNVDFNNTFGSNRFHYYVEKTLNSSLLEQSPSRFDAGGFQLDQNTTGLHFTRFFDKVLAGGTNIAFGTEFRTEHYKIFAGEEASWKAYGTYDLVPNSSGGVDTVYKAAGAQGFPGFQPANQVDEYRTNLGVYVDAEFNFSKRFMVDAAARFERYNDFGNTINGKLAARFEVSKALAFRGSVSTGFRAPSLAQIYFNTAYTNVVAGKSVDNLLARNNSNITRVLGVDPLKQEKALNASFGITSRPAKGLSITIDGYYVKIQDRIVLTGDFNAESAPEIKNELEKLNVSVVKFFSNALDTKTLGVDAIITWSKFFGPHSFNASFAANFNRLETGRIKTAPKLVGREDVYFSKREEAFLLASAPPSKLNLTLDYRFRSFNANLRFVRFDRVKLIDYNGDYDTFDPRITTDLSLGYQFGKVVTLVIGGSNLFNVLPNRQDAVLTDSGGPYEPVQMGFNGTTFFSKLAFKF